MTICKLVDHPSNLDPHALLVWRNPSQEYVANVYRISGGKYMATLPGYNGIVELFETQQAAIDAQNSQLRASKRSVMR